MRTLGIPTIRDRVVQGALKLILEPIFEADFQEGSYGYRPGRQAAEAIEKVSVAILQNKTKVIDLDLKSYFDNVRHHILFEQVAKRVDDDKIMHLLKQILKANTEKTSIVNLTKDQSFSFLGFDFRRVRSENGKWYPRKTPKIKKRTELLQKLKQEFRRLQTQPLDLVIYVINPIIRGWVNYYRIGNSMRCFNYIRDWVEKKVRRHLMKARQRRGFGWKRWSKDMLYRECGLFRDYHIQYYQPVKKVLPAR